MIITISQTTFSPPSRSLGAHPTLRGYYSMNFMAGDGATPIEMGNGRTGFYYEIECSLNGDGDVVIPAFQIQSTLDGTPGTARFIGQLWSTARAPGPIVFGTGGNGWQIPTFEANVNWADLYRYNLTATLVYPPATYPTYAQMIAEIDARAGQFDYARVGHAGITEMRDAPDVASEPKAIGANSYAQTGLAGITRISVEPSSPAQAATGGWSLIGVPSDGDTFAANGATFTFKTSPVGAYEIQIDGRVIANNASNAATVLNASTDPLVSVATYVANDLDIEVTYDTAGTVGNSYTTTAPTVYPILPFGETLSGGLPANIPNAVGKNDYASTTNLGIIKTNVAPASASSPIAVGSNWLRLSEMTRDISEFITPDTPPNLGNAVFTLGSLTPVTLTISTNTAVTANVTVPKNIILRFTGDGYLTITTGFTCTIQSDNSNYPIKKIFYNATAGLGSAVFSGGDRTSVLRPQWWGALGDGATSDTAALTAMAATAALLPACTAKFTARDQFVTSTVSFGSTLTLDFTEGGALYVTTGQTVTITGPIIAPIGQKIFYNATSGLGTISFTGNTSIDCYYIDWWGTPGGTNDTAICQAAAAAFPIGAHIKLVPNRTYASQHITVKRNQTWEIGSGVGIGATMVALLDNTTNMLFDIGATTEFGAWATSTALSSATQSATSITVTSSSGFTAGDRVLVSAGTYTGSGTEQGPIEYNTVASVPDGTHVVVKTPLAYNYSGFGLPGAANKKLYKVPSTQARNVRITGGTMQPGANAHIYFQANNTEDVEIDHIYFDGMGASLLGGGYNNRLNFHDNVSRGTPLTGNVAINQAGMIYSRIENNVFNSTLLGAASADVNNNFNLEVACHDNLIANNLMGPIRGQQSAAIDLGNYAFNNTIVNNRIWGLPLDVTANLITLGIRTTQTGTPANTGNIIRGNMITNLFRGIGDQGDLSVIEGNSLYSLTSPSTSQGISTDSLKGTVGNNTIVGFDLNTINTALSGVPTLRSTLGRSYFFEGNGSPESAVTAPVGSLYRRLDGGVNTTLYIKQTGTGDTGWAAVTP